MGMDSSYDGHEVIETDTDIGADQSIEAVRIGDELTVTIEEILKSGRGMARIKGKVGNMPYLIFVKGKNLKVGDVVKVTILRTEGGSAVAMPIR